MHLLHLLFDWRVQFFNIAFPVEHTVQGLQWALSYLSEYVLPSWHGTQWISVQFSILVPHGTEGSDPAGQEGQSKHWYPAFPAAFVQIICSGLQEKFAPMGQTYWWKNDTLWKKLVFAFDYQYLLLVLVEWADKQCCSWRRIKTFIPSILKSLVSHDWLWAVQFVHKSHHILL